MIGVLWAYEGWQYPTFNAGEVINPQRNFPRAFFIGTVALIGIYLIANFAYIAALGPGRRCRLDKRRRRVSDCCNQSNSGEADRDHDPDFGLQRRQQQRAQLSARVLRDGERRFVLQEARRGSSAVRHAGVRDRCRLGVGDGARGRRHIHGVVDLRRILRMDILWPVRGDNLRLSQALSRTQSGLTKFPVIRGHRCCSSSPRCSGGQYSLQQSKRPTRQDRACAGNHRARAAGVFDLAQSRRSGDRPNRPLRSELAVALLSITSRTIPRLPRPLRPS